MLKTKVMLATLLSVFAIGLSSASSASATGYVIWGAEWCMPVPIGKGGFIAGCRGAFNGGNFARAISWPNYLTFACLWMGLGAGMLADPGCVWLGPGWGYEVWADAPALSVTVKGGPYTFESKIVGVKLKVKCTTMQAKEPSVESGGADDGGKPGMLSAASLEYTGCIPEEPKHCEVKSPSLAAGTVASNALLGSFVENAGKTKVENLFKPHTGTVFAELEFTGSECSIKSTKAKIEGSTLTDGGSEDEISNALKVEALGSLGTAGDEDLNETAVEKFLLLSEPSNKKYFNDETSEEKEAKLTFEKEEVKLTGEASLLGKIASTKFRDEETGEEVTFPEGVADLGLDRD
jgi:hypothetical protein